MMMRFVDVEFIKSVYKIQQLPPPELPEFAFAGRSNVGKSSLMNRLFNRKKLVKISSKPGKTQSLNFFLADQELYMVDLPGYGFARVSKNMQNEWQQLITSYLETRENLRCVIVIIDIRHSLKEQDRSLFEWLVATRIPCVPVYTKADKLSKNQCQKHAAQLDSALHISASERIIFSSKTGAGRDQLIAKMAAMIN